MNKHLHRLIFNAARGIRMAVSEVASGHGKGRADGCGTQASRAGARPKGAVTDAVMATTLATAALAACAFAAIAWLSIAQAQIVADPSVPGNQRPTVLGAANGVPLVNIQTPSATGVSRNSYSQFDVQRNGAILNNARSNAQTQLGGWVQANPWLAGGAARVILNEINSSHPSQLRGFVEVGGSRAEVIIANPSGVAIDGGGFINASRVTLTTGTPVMNGGNLEGYLVQKGRVSINGAGLDASQTDFTGIIARAVEVNAGIWAKELKVTTGANQVDVAQSAATPLAGVGAAPAFALDVSQLGGMYAGKITLVGTEAGVGVRNSGTIGASAGQVFVTVDGMLQNAGRITSTVATRLDAGGGISNTASGTVYSTGDTRLSTQGHISNAGLLGALGNTTLAATGANSQVNSGVGSVLAAGLQEDGTLAAASSGSGNLNIHAAQNIAANGQNLSAGDQVLSARSVNIAGSQISANNLALAAGTGDIDASAATVAVVAGLTFTTPGTLRTDAAKVSSGRLSLTVQELSNVSGEIIQTGSGDTSLSATGAINNTGGRIAGNGNTRISAQSLLNQRGSVQAAGAAHLHITTSDALDNSASGKLTAGGNATLATGSLNNSQGQIKAGGTLSASANQAISNAQGLIAANGAVALTAAGLDNTQGTVASIHNNVGMTSTGITTNDSGRIEAAGHVALSNAGLSNAFAVAAPQAGSISGANVGMDTHGQAFNNTGGTVAASQSATLNTGVLNNNAGLIQAGGALFIDTHGQVLTNTNAASHATGEGGITAQGAATLRTADLTNTAGFIGAQGPLSITGTHLSNTAGGQIMGESTVTMTGTGFDNQGGQVQALGNVAIDGGAGTVHNSTGLIRSANTVTLTATAVTNSNTSGTNQGVEGKNVTLTASSIANNSGAIRADNDATLTSNGSINNSSGLVSAGNVLTLQGTASTPTLAIINSAGTIIADQNTRVKAASLTGDGKVLSKGDLSITLSTDFNNSGEVTANRNASIETTGRLTNQGQLRAGQALTLKAGTLNNQATGEIRGTAVKLIATDANTLTNRGLIDGVETVIETITLNNLGTGRIYGDHVAIGATTLSNLAEGGAAPVIAARNRLDIGAATINNAEHALLFSGGDMAIGGSLDSNRQATGQADTLNNASATIEALGSLRINAVQINNSNNHFNTQVMPLSSTGITEFQGSGSGTRYLAGTAGLYIYNDESDHLATPDGGRYEAWSRYQYTRSISETVVTASDPGQILSGGTMTLNAAKVFNDKSRIIAGSTLAGSIGSLTNTEVAGERVINDSGSVISYWRNRKRGRDDTGTSSAAYNPATVVQGISLTPTVYRQYTAPVGSGTTLAGVALGSVSGSTSAAARPGAMVQVSSAVGASALVVRTLHINTSLPNNSLFRLNPSPGSNYLVETDSRFASYRTWLSSDYLVQSLGLDPSVTQKRLGDGFYEQKLIREQVAQLTGRRFLDTYQSDEAQYQALMAGSVTFAQQSNLRPGIALSAAQMAVLTSDIVWLVEREVTLPDGTVTQALVPQVYARVQAGDLTGDGALLSADAIKLNLSGDLTNSGTLAGRQVVSLNAQNVANLGGRIRGDAVRVQAKEDLNNIGGSITAGSELMATAGRDLNVTTTSSSQTGSTGSRTNIDRVAGLYVSNPGGSLIASAGRDISLLAAQLLNNAPTAAGQPAGTTLIAAGRDLNLGTVLEASSNTIRWSANNYRNDSQRTEVGTSIQTSGNLQLSAGKDLNARAAQISSSQGSLTLTAGNDIKLSAGESRQTVDEGHQHTSKGFLSKKTITTRETLERTDSVGSSLSGNTVTLAAGKDIKVKGSSAVSDNATSLVAGNNISLEAAQNTYASSSLRDEKKSGIFSGGGLSITAGKQQQSTDTQTTRTSAAASTVGSIAGNVSIQAAESYKQVGSDVLTPGGDIRISAKKVDIIEAKEVSQTTTEQKFKQSGLTLAITSPVISAIQTAQQMAQAAGDTSNGRMQLLAAANVGLAGKNAYDAIKAGQGTAMNGKQGQIATGGKNPDGTPASRDANAADQAGGINLAISIGGSQSQSNTASQSDSAGGSSVKAGGNITIIAAGAAQDSNLTIQGSAIEAGKSALLFADNQIKLLAAVNESSQKSTNKSSSGSIGVSVGTDGFMVNLNASAGKGKADGSDTSYTNTQIKAGNSAGDSVTLKSSGDTTLKGAVIAANAVKAGVGGNLNIESLQDTSTYTSKNQSLGGSLSVGYGNMSGSINASKSNTDSNFKSVGEQSGIKAGDGGFDVNVKGNTDLKGGVIASTDKAVDEGRNTFTTGGALTSSDIQNKADYKASGFSVSMGSSGGSTGLSGGGIGKDQGSASSTTAAGISGLAGNAAVRTGDAPTGIGKIFDADKVQKDINAQVQITQAFGQQASQAVGDYTQGQMKALRERYASAASPQEKAALQVQVDELRMQSQVMNVLIGAVTGLGGTALAKETLSAVAEEMRKLTIEDSKKFAGITDGVTTLTNTSGVSVGGAWDLKPEKIGGTRADPDGLCGKSNERCVVQRDANLDPILDASGKTQLVYNADGKMQFAAKDDNGNPMSLAAFLESPAGQKMAGATGGIQGWTGTLFGFPYPPGGLIDKLHEAFGGPHDHIGGKVSGLYDEGNIKRGMTKAEDTLRQAWSGVALVPSAPFAMATLLPPEVWKAISILLGAAK